ncbi:MAG TPA: hypothetical protein VFK47_14615 [Ktedonobacteraceae bacterium]|nr:hypothetical protein [Ktedonobacteraceae bacterium]
MDETTAPVVLNVTEEQFAQHMARVEMLCNLVISMMKAMIGTPFGAMLPPDIVQQVKGLG